MTGKVRAARRQEKIMDGVRHYQDIATRIYKNALRNYQRAHEITSQLSKNIYCQGDYQSLPQWAHERIVGYIEALQYMHEENYIENRVFYKGNYINTLQQAQIPEAERSEMWNTAIGGYFFYKGTDKPYILPE